MSWVLRDREQGIHIASTDGLRPGASSNSGASGDLFLMAGDCVCRQVSQSAGSKLYGLVLLCDWELFQEGSRVCFVSLFSDP